MQTWIDVYDPTYSTIVADGPIFIESVIVNRGLDEIGDCSISLSGVDPRAIAYIQPRRVLEIWISSLELGKRKVGAFVVEGETHADSDTKTLSVAGRSTAVALADKLALSGPSMVFEQETVQSVVNDVIALAGWTASVDASVASNLINVTFTDDKVLRALQTIAEIQGVHLRESESVAKQIDFGPFGANPNNLHIEYIEGESGDIHRDPHAILLMEQATVVRESAEIFNWAKGFAGGSGSAAIDLGLSDRSFVESVFVNGEFHHIIKNDASIAKHGEIQRRVDVKKITPTSSTDSAMLHAANAAADAIKAKLDRHAFSQEVISVVLRNVTETVSVGDKVRLTYIGVMNKHGLPYKWREIDDDYWVMQATEQITESGTSLVLELSNFDTHQANTETVVVGMVDAIDVQNVDVQPYPTNYPWGPFQQPIDTLTDVSFPFPIFDNVLRLNSVVAFIIRDVWTAVAGTAAAGGDHRHLVADLVGASAFNSSELGNMEFQFASDIGGGGTFNTKIAASFAADWFTSGASGDHTHDTEFNEVQKDNVKPEGLDVDVNGVTVDTGLFPDDMDPKYITADIVRLDITDEVLNKAGGFRGWHTMDISCGTNRGDISVVFFIDVDISKVKLG